MPLGVCLTRYFGVNASRHETRVGEIDGLLLLDGPESPLVITHLGYGFPLRIRPFSKSTKLNKNALKKDSGFYNIGCG